MDMPLFEIDEPSQERGDQFAARTGFDARTPATPHRWFRISPRRHPCLT